MKTGFICDSGFNIVASATRDGRRLIAVVLGEPSGADRTVRAANLLEHGFHTAAWKAIFPSPTLDTMPIPEDAKGPTSVRQEVVSFDCGGGGRRAVARARKKRDAAQAVSEKAPKQHRAPAKKAKSAQKATNGPAQP